MVAMQGVATGSKRRGLCSGKSQEEGQGTQSFVQSLLHEKAILLLHKTMTHAFL